MRLFHKSSNKFKLLLYDKVFRNLNCILIKLLLLKNLNLFIFIYYFIVEFYYLSKENLLWDLLIFVTFFWLNYKLCTLT